MSQWVRMLLRIRFFQIGCFLFFCSFFSCSSESEGNETVSLFKLSGKSQGTTYLIQVYDDQLNFEAREIDSLLHAFDQQLSTYDTSSLISRFNQ